MAILITLPELDSEQQVALGQLAGGSTSQEWGKTVLVGLINEQVEKNIDAKGLELLAGAKSLPPAKRLQFTAETAQRLQTIADS